MRHRTTLLVAAFVAGLARMAAGQAVDHSQGEIPNLVFRSTWPVSGNTYDIVHDGGKWNDNLCNPSTPANAALVMVSSRWFAWRYTGAPGVCYMLHTSGQFPAPKVGESAFYRFYYRNSMGDGQDLGQAHWLQATSIKSWEFKTGTASAGKYALRFVMLNYADAQPYNKNLNWYLRGLKLNTVYRIEMRLRRTAPNVAKVDFLVIGADSSVYRSKNWVNDGGAKLTSSPDLYVSDADFHTFELGNNDPRTTGVGYMAIADFAVRISADTSAWIGK